MCIYKGCARDSVSTFAFFQYACSEIHIFNTPVQSDPKRRVLPQVVRKRKVGLCLVVWTDVEDSRQGAAEPSEDWVVQQRPVVLRCPGPASPPHVWARDVPCVFLNVTEVVAQSGVAPTLQDPPPKELQHDETTIQLRPPPQHQKRPLAHECTHTLKQRGR